VTLNGSQAPSAFSDEVRKWLLVPPSGIGALLAERPGRNRSNQVLYSAVNQRVNRFWLALK
jgi:hypothetical protein